MFAESMEHSKIRLEKPVILFILIAVLGEAGRMWSLGIFECTRTHRAIGMLDWPIMRPVGAMKVGVGVGHNPIGYCLIVDVDDDDGVGPDIAPFLCQTRVDFLGASAVAIFENRKGFVRTRWNVQEDFDMSSGRERIGFAENFNLWRGTARQEDKNKA